MEEAKTTPTAPTETDEPVDGAENIVEESVVIEDTEVENPTVDGVTLDEVVAVVEKVEAEQAKEKETETKHDKHLRIAIKTAVSIVITLVLVGGGMVTGAWLQRKGNIATTLNDLKESLAVNDLVDKEGGVDLTVGLLMSQMQNQNKNEAITVGQLVDGSGGGKLVGSVMPIPQGDKLTLELLKMHNEQKNSCYSPLSIRYALEMLREGAGGETRAQIENLLGGIGTTRYENVKDHLSIANSLWIKDDFAGAVKESYQNALKEKFNAEVRRDSFQSPANMNRWIEDNSFGMLKNVLSEQDIAEVETLLANVLAIDMNWQYEYSKEATRGELFGYDWDKGDEDYVEYTTMTRWGGEDIYYNLAADATVLAQDLKEYNGTQLQFVAIMPENLPEFVKNVNNTQVNKLLLGLRQAVRQNDTYNFSFAAFIPKFGMQSGIKDLIADLKELGVTDAFDAAKADLSGITDEKDFYIMKGKQDTKFDFSEEGIRAAAVTVFGGGMGGGGRFPIPSSAHIVVSINKPFMYLVRDVKTGEIWFTGVVYEPNLWENDKAQYAPQW